MPEIERKFRLADVPSTSILCSGTLILQGYVLTHPGELRLRRKGEQSYLTVKSGGGLTRDEWESELPSWVFDALWSATEGRRIEKTRYSVPHGMFTLEIDIYHASLSGLVTLECEFTTEDTASTFQLPPWAIDAVDVTVDSAYKNKNLALHGLPA